MTARTAYIVGATVLQGVCLQARAQIIYTDNSATGPNHDGASWCSAFTTLQNALAVAQSGDTIRLAQGTYKPDQGTAVTPGDRSATFQLVSGVVLEGGYAGCGHPDPDARDVALYETVLSGDLLGNDLEGFGNNDENSWHVVTATNTAKGTRLDGLSIIRGRTQTGCSFANEIPCAGGGVLHDGGNLEISYCKVSVNQAYTGGGVYSEGGTLSISGSEIDTNSATRGGGIRTQLSVFKMDQTTVTHNSAEWGAGIMNEDSPQTVLTGCTIRKNSATGPYTWGGGMRNWTSNLIATDCLFEENASNGVLRSRGGGLYNAGNERGKTLTLIRCVFRGNSVAEEGGGLSSSQGADLATDCKFIGNAAGETGGGVYRRGPTSAVFINCEFAENTALAAGGGVWNSDESRPAYVNCVFKGNTANRGGGLASNGFAGAMLINSTVFHNTAGTAGGGIWNCTGSHSFVLNTILWGNQDSIGSGELAQLLLDTTTNEHFSCGDAESTASVHHSAVQGWSGSMGGAANTGLDPMFINPNGGDGIPGTEDDDLHLLPISPALDAGINLALPNDRYDLDGDGDTDERIPTDLAGSPRILRSLDLPGSGRGSDPVVDLGAYEGSVDCNGNGVYDPSDIATGTSLDCNLNTIPDECEISVDCNDNGVCDAEDVLLEISEDCNANGVPDECEMDCNSNGSPDDCDIATRQSDDCNLDGIPDECLTVLLDCNNNQLVDACETAAGTTPDVNMNGRPDECEPNVLFVRQGATGLRNGVSWDDAFDDLKRAFAVASESTGLVQEIWVAAGSYTPDGGTGDRSASFLLPNGVAVYGGFSGNETSKEERSSDAGLTLLSGDLLGNDTGGFRDVSRLDNAYHVVTSIDVNPGTILDGLTIDGGYATPLAPMDRSRGAGIWNSGDPVLTNVMLRSNWTVGDGAGMYSRGDPEITECALVDNWAGNWGGGLFIDAVHPTSPTASPLVVGTDFVDNEATRGGGVAVTWSGAEPMFLHCRFLGNFGSGVGGAVYNDNNTMLTFLGCLLAGNRAHYSGGVLSELNATSNWTNCTIVNNTTDLWGPGGVFADAASGEKSRFSNCILWGNENEYGQSESAQIAGRDLTIDYSLVQGWTGALGGVGNIDADPLLVDADRFRLSPGSPAINDGDPDFASEPGETDLDGRPRVLCGRVDCGAYEFGIDDYNCDRVVDLTDLSFWDRCMTGPDAGPYPEGCEAFDANADVDTDLHDFATFQSIGLQF